MQKNKKIYKKWFVILIKPIIFAPSLEKHFDLVAQLVEHLPFKEMVLGSSPSRVTRKTLHILGFARFCFLKNHCLLQTAFLKS